MAVKVSLDHNIGQVRRDIQDVKDDIRSDIPTAIVAAMQTLKSDMIASVKYDSDWRGNLVRSIQSHGVDVTPTGNGEYEISVGTDASIAPYAPFVEFGTGKRSGQHARAMPTSVDEYPEGYPFDPPPMHPDLVDEIIEWVKTKPVIPKEDMSQEELGFTIAATIVEKGTYAHPFLRPAWFRNELQIKKAARNAVRKAVR